MKIDEKLSKLPISRSGDRAPRFHVTGHATLTVPESNLRMECQINNISRTGVLVYFAGHVQRPLESGETVQLIMEPIPHLFEHPIMCKAGVARMGQIKTEDQTMWHIGLKFQDG